MRPVPRGLSNDEAALWRKVAATVTPLLAASSERSASHAPVRNSHAG